MSIEEGVSRLLFFKSFTFSAEIYQNMTSQTLSSYSSIGQIALPKVFGHEAHEEG